MSIIYSKDEQFFNLHTAHSTYQMKIGHLGHLLHTYYGRRIPDVYMNQLENIFDRGFSGNPYDAGSVRTFSADTMAAEYPGAGIGDFRISGCSLLWKDGSCAADFRYKGYEIYEGKKPLKGQPASYDNGGECQTLEITLEDKVYAVRAVLCFHVFEAKDMITRSVRFENASDDSVVLKRAMSACLDLQPGEWDVIHFHGRHCMERMQERVRQPHAVTRISSCRGYSSHQHNPFVIMADKNASEVYGDCYGMMFVYSGDFAAEIEQDQSSRTRVVMGINPDTFSWNLQPGAEFETPEVIMSFSYEGFGALSNQYHEFLRENICRGKYKHERRPVLVNNWEGTYFDFNHDKLMAIAKEAANLGIELFVLDDGWFGNRCDDNRALGDWFVNEEKVNLTELADDINALGMKFGLWIEPEMINEDSKLYEEHPDWALKIPGRDPNRSRFQLVLDFSRKEVVDAIYESIASVLRSANVEYVKWDVNRSIADTYSLALPADRQGEVRHRYMLGVYDFADRLTKEFPNVLLEGCSGGGGRFDAAMLYYSPQIWCSDDTDAEERIVIQHGTSFGYPASAVGSHVSAVPNHQTGRISSLELRGLVATSGMLGYELDLTKLSRKEKAHIRRQILEYKKYADIVMNGSYYRLSNPIENDDFCAWSFVSKNRKKCLFDFAMLHRRANPIPITIRLQGLNPKALYKVRGQETIYSGAALMYGGYTLPMTLEDGQVSQIYFEQVKAFR